MRIGFDATALPRHPTGAGNYMINLVRALGQIDRRNDYYIFLKPADQATFDQRQGNFHLVTVDPAARPLRLLWEQTGLPWQVRRLRLDVLHSPHYTSPIPRQCKSVVTFCDMTFQLLPELHSLQKRAFFGGMMRWSAGHADRLIAISESTRQDVIRLLHVAPERIVTTPLAAGPEYRVMPRTQVAEVCARYGLNPAGYVYYVGVLEPRKNVPVLIEAFARVAAEAPDVPLVIAGKKGWMYDAIFARVAALGLQERVRFLGHVPQADLIALYNGARVFVYPSRYEGFGLPVLEAMQCGAPVITTDVSSMPEVAGDATLLVPPDDADALSEALRRVLADDALARDLAARGPLRAARFSWRRCAEETLQVYRDVTGS